MQEKCGLLAAIIVQIECRILYVGSGHRLISILLVMFIYHEQEQEKACSRTAGQHTLLSTDNNISFQADPKALSQPPVPAA